MFSQRDMYQFYSASPAVLRNLFDNVYRFLPERLLRSPATIRHLRELESSQWWDTERMDAWRLQKLRDLLRHAGRHVPYYRDLFTRLRFSPEDLSRLDDITALPVLTLDMIRELGPQLLPVHEGRNARYVAATSGSTGNYLECVRDRGYYAWEQAFLLRYQRWHGATLGMRQAMFYRAVMRHPVESPSDPPYERYRNRLILSQFHTDAASVRFAHGLLRDFKPEHILIFPTTLQVLTRVMIELGYSAPCRPRFIVCYSENLYEAQRHEAEAFWGCPVYNRYGHSEGCVSAAECPEKRLHVSPELGYLEILDEAGHAVPAGQSGRVIATGFLTHAMPLIRYDTRDRATRSAESCPCGRGLPVLASVDGRADDIVRAKDGKAVASLRSIFAHTQGIRLTQIVQEHPGELIIRIVPDGEYHPSVQQHILENLRHDVGDVFDVRFEIVEDIERTPSGKIRLVRCLHDTHPVSSG